MNNLNLTVRAGIIIKQLDNLKKKQFKTIWVYYNLWSAYHRLGSQVWIAVRIARGLDVKV